MKEEELTVFLSIRYAFCLYKIATPYLILPYLRDLLTPV
jgi:hypothetical protein